MNKLKTKAGSSRGNLRWLVGALAAAALLVATGCGKKEAQAPAPAAGSPAAEAATAVAAQPPDPVDLTGFIKAFSGAEPGLKLFGEDLVATIRARAFADAAEELQKMSRNQKLNAAQRQAIQDLTAKVQGLLGGR